MRHIRMLGLCLLAALAVCAYAVSSASALPEFGKCEAEAGGKYQNSNCTEKAKKGSGAYEWLKAAQVEKNREAEGKPGNVPFSGGNVGSGGVLASHFAECKTVENSASARVPRKKCEEMGGEVKEAGSTEVIKVECEAESNTGEVSGKKNVANVAVRFTGCKLFGTAPCSNTANSGEVQTNILKGELGYITKATHKVGLLLEPAAKKGIFAHFICAAIDEVVVGMGNSKEGTFYRETSGAEKHGGYDGIISPITPVNEMTTKYTQDFTFNSDAENIPNKFEGKHIDLLEDYLYNTTNPTVTTMWSAAGEEITNENITEEAGEIKA